MTTPDVEQLMERLGRKQHHDPKNKLYPVEPQALVETFPRTVVHRDARPAKYHLYQPNNGCTGFSMACTLNHRPFHKLHAPTFDNEAGTKFYTWATQRDVWPGEYPDVDDGSSGGAAAEGLRDNGLITAYAWVFTESMFWAGLSQGPLSVGTVWKRGMFEPDSDGIIRPTGDEVGGHQYTIDAYSKKTDLFRIDQSWGHGWGKNGYGFISRADLFDLVFRQGGDCVQLVL